MVAHDAGPVTARHRRARMVDLLRELGYLRVSELARHFVVSEVTIRADLDELESQGELRRVRGGAVPRTLESVERRFEEAEIAGAAQKRAIAKAAAKLVRDGDTIVLDVGSTTTAVAHELAKRHDLHDVTAFTSSLTIALALEHAAPRITIVVTGGTLRPRQHSLVEPLAGLVLATITAGKAFLGCNGVDLQRGVTNINLPETEVKRRILAASQERIVCADSTKLGQVALAHVCDLAEVDLLVTDDLADPDLIAALRAGGLEVQLAPVQV
jgi:DeoR family transcriptional regulator, aga operon transcriptional repressor